MVSLDFQENIANSNAMKIENFCNLYLLSSES